MVHPREDVTLRKGRAERFQEIWEQIEDRRGHDVDKTDVMDEMMDAWDRNHTRETAD
jgi:restriction endonuclease